jgi:PiT family inorganic phosphate transporter
LHSDALLVLVIAAALAFDFTNGFHDTANVVASVISTRAMSPRTSVLLAAILNFVGALISLKVAATIAGGIIDATAVTETIAFAGLIGALTWNLITWVYGLPSSSSHALIGGMIGALLAGAGSGVRWHGVLTKVAIPAVVAPLLALVLAALSIFVLYRLFGQRRPGTVRKTFRYGQILSSGALSLSHGTNDAQKTMGVICLALVAHGDLRAHGFHVPSWVVLSAATAIALGTYAGGWRIIRTVGSRIIRMDVAQGVSAQGSGAIVILVSSHLGYPLSSTQVISGGVIGAGVAKRLSAVRWGVAGDIAAAWALTLPLSALLGALTYWASRLFGTGALGPALISILALSVLVRGLARRYGVLNASAPASLETETEPDVGELSPSTPG